MKEAKKFGTYNPGLTDRLVEYGPSSIKNAGNGIHAGEMLFVNDIVTQYSGKLTRKKPTTPKECEYCMDLSNRFLIGDFTPVLNKGLASFVNREERGVNKRKNCVIIEGDDKKLAYLHVTKPIKKGEELVTVYGKGYKINRKVCSFCVCGGKKPHKDINSKYCLFAKNKK